MEFIMCGHFTRVINSPFTAWNLWSPRRLIIRHKEHTSNTWGFYWRSCNKEIRNTKQIRGATSFRWDKVDSPAVQPGNGMKGSNGNDHRSDATVRKCQSCNARPVRQDSSYHDSNSDMSVVSINLNKQSWNLITETVINNMSRKASC